MFSHPRIMSNLFHPTNLPNAFSSKYFQVTQQSYLPTRNAEDPEYFWNSVSKLPVRRIDFRDKKQVALHDEIVALVERAQRAAAAKEKARSPHDIAEREREVALIDDRIETIVRGLYGITEDEAAVMEVEMAPVEVEGSGHVAT